MKISIQSLAMVALTVISFALSPKRKQSVRHLTAAIPEATRRKGKMPF
jgi:hypothetical protein